MEEIRPVSIAYSDCAFARSAFWLAGKLAALKIFVAPNPTGSLVATPKLAIGTFCVLKACCHSLMREKLPPMFTRCALWDQLALPIDCWTGLFAAKTCSAAKDSGHRQDSANILSTARTAAAGWPPKT